MSLLLAQLSGLQNYTLTVSVGTYTLTGIAVTFDIVMPVSAGAYVLTGVAAFFAIVMPAVAGSCALTAVAAAINSARSLGASAGSDALTGVAAFFAIVMPAARGVQPDGDGGGHHLWPQSHRGGRLLCSPGDHRG